MTDTAVVKTGTPPADEPELRLKRQPGYHDLMALVQTLLQTGFLPQAIRTPGQALAAHRLPQFEEPAGFDLPNPFARDAIAAGHFIQSPSPSVP